MTMQKTVLIIGATSDMARATAKLYGDAGWNILLAARDTAAAEREATDIRVRTQTPVTAITLDILDQKAVEGFADTLPVLPDTVISFAGLLGTQSLAETDTAHATLVLRTNFEGPALVLEQFANRFAARGSGTIVGVSSVAGDRGRGSNYVYGAAKAGFTAYLSGLRNRMWSKGVHVVTVKPGFVRTRMTSGMALPPLITAMPDEIARAIFRAAEKGNGGTIYVRPVWRVVMGVIKAIPDTVFRRMKL
jgi:decaprenylphospho-beta-D-erythro-pentofuranosid-2-ulose 2-reductase